MLVGQLGCDPGQKCLHRRDRIVLNALNARGPEALGPATQASDQDEQDQHLMAPQWIWSRLHGRLMVRVWPDFGGIECASCVPTHWHSRRPPVPICQRASSAARPIMWHSSDTTDLGIVMYPWLERIVIDRKSSLSPVVCHAAQACSAISDSVCRAIINSSFVGIT